MIYKPAYGDGGLNYVSVIIQGFFMCFGIFLIMFLFPILMGGQIQQLAGEKIATNIVMYQVSNPSASNFVLVGICMLILFSWGLYVINAKNIVFVEINNENRTVAIGVKQIKHKAHSSVIIPFKELRFYTSTTNNPDGSKSVSITFSSTLGKIGSIKASNSIFSNSVWDVRKDHDTIDGLIKELKSIKDNNILTFKKEHSENVKIS